MEDLAAYVRRIEACRICVDRPRGAPLPHAPRPVLQVSASARLLIAGQAPGARAHASGLPFDDASGERLRFWLGIDRATFYDASRVAVAAMGFCFPGYDSKGADLPPRRECRDQWHDGLFALTPRIALVVAVGRAAQSYHAARLGRAFPAKWRMDEIIRHFAAQHAEPRLVALPHPSWRNTAWLKRNHWFETEILPSLRQAVAEGIKFHH